MEKDYYKLPLSIVIHYNKRGGWGIMCTSKSEFQRDLFTKMLKCVNSVNPKEKKQNQPSNFHSFYKRIGLTHGIRDFIYKLPILTCFLRINAS